MRNNTGHINIQACQSVAREDLDRRKRGNRSGDTADQWDTLVDDLVEGKVLSPFLEEKRNSSGT